MHRELEETIERILADPDDDAPRLDAIVTARAAKVQRRTADPPAGNRGARGTTVTSRRRARPDQYRLRFLARRLRRLPFDLPRGRGGASMKLGGSCAPKPLA